MSQRTHLLPLIAIVALLIHTQSISGQSEAVTLQWKMTPGEAFFLSTTGNVQMTLDTSAGVRQTVESRFEARDAIRVLDVAALGAIWIEATVEDYRVTERGGQPQEELLPAVSFRVDPDGKVVERFADPAERPDFPFPLPGKPVRVGESWTRSATSTSGEIVVKGNGRYTLARLGSSPDGRLARVTFTNEGTASGGGAVLGIPTATRATTKVTGEFEWLLDRGRFGRYVQEFTLTADTQVNLPGVFGMVRLSSKATVRSDPLPSERASPTAPGPDLTITPGHGIGPFTLSMATQELNRQNGDSELREFDLGYLSDSLRWRNGLVAYVARDDSNKVIGLETRERRYRSSKGISVTMSQGAAMLAHGLMPVRVEMSIPGQGHHRTLVYDDQGIAFTVVSEENVRTRTFTRIPVGLVAWITVFPPGEGGKIFPLPGRR